jgi:hypothetical protein
MPNEAKIWYSVALALVACQQIVVNRSYTKLLEKKLDEQEAQMRYLCHILNRENIELDEFDFIALPSVKLVPREEAH